MRTRGKERPAHDDGARRLFFALWPGDAVRAALAGAADTLRSTHPARGRWLEPRHYHLTLRFLGDCDPAQEAAALDAGAAVRASRFDLAFDRAGSFDNRSIPWWLGCAQVPAGLQRLWEALDAALRSAGVPGERDHPPVAHVTVLRDARARLPGVPIAPVSWPVHEFVLVHSLPGRHPAYHPIARWRCRRRPDLPGGSMSSRDPRIDAFIARQADFARPILEYLRECVHEACPGAEETMKWNAPAFVHAGGIVCMMAAFKRHASFGYWQHALVMGEQVPREGMGSYGKLSSLRDLPPRKTLLAHIRKATRLNEGGVKSAGARKAAVRRPAPEAPPELLGALRANPEAKAVFAAFPPGQQREYIDWITGAKLEETRAKRLAQAVEWMAEGKRRNWKYEAC